MVRTKDPFYGIENADRLSAAEKKKLLAEAESGREQVRVGPSTVALIVSDLLTFVVVASAAYLAGQMILSSLTAALL